MGVNGLIGPSDKRAMDLAAALNAGTSVENPSAVRYTRLMMVTVSVR